MRMAFLVNDVQTEVPLYTTTGLALAAHGRDHEVWYLGIEDMAMASDRSLHASAIRVPDKGFRTRETFLSGVKEADRRDMALDELDVLWLRNDPGGESAERSWARTVGVHFGQLLARQGVLVLNDPAGLNQASSKMYLQSFPESVRPRTLITRDEGAVRAFLDDEGTDIILKPLQGSGGDRVFVVRADDMANLNQIFETVAASGYVIVQEYLPAAEEGDIRFFLMNGRPLEVDGHHAAIRRVHQGDDLRNNMSAGAEAVAVEMTPALLEIAEAVRPRLIDHGMFLVGLDIAGDKILEINVYSPGGLNSCSELEGVDFHAPVIAAVEAKMEILEGYGADFSNARLATL